MASKTKFLLLAAFLLSTLLLVTGKASQEDSHNSTNHDGREVNVSGIASALKEKDYNAAAWTLETTLSSLIGNQNSTGFTIFCPTDVAYALSRYVQPPPTLVAYHVTPSYLQREDLELRSGALRMHSGINTLLPGHPLVVTTQLPSTNLNPDIQAELNLVNVIDWNIYDNGKVIVHGIKDFFDPAIQTILFPSLEHHEILKTTMSEEKEQNLDFLALFGLVTLIASGLAFLAYLYLRSSSSEGFVVLQPNY